MGSMNLSALNLLNDFGCKISSVSGDDRVGYFLFVCRSFCSVIIPFCCMKVSFRVTAWSSSHSRMILTFFVFNPRDL